MGYFDNCRPDQRFTIRHKFFDNCVVNDWDQRRVVTVHTSWAEQDEDFIFDALARHIDNIPADTVLLEVSREGDLLSCSSDVEDDRTMVPFYPSVRDFPPGLQRINRSDLTEVDRLGIQADLVTYDSQSCPGNVKRVAFKYYLNEPQVAIFWHELNCVLRIPKHPNIVPFDSLVVDTIDGEDRVVGFTTPFIDGGTVEDNTDRVFKLVYLEQLLHIIDYLNLTLGIVHGDICPWNLLINPDTDNLQIFDFNMAAKLGWEGDTSDEGQGAFAYDEHRNDVKCAVFTLYEVITRDLHFREEYYPHELDVSMLLDMDDWEKHPDARLDADVTEYRQLLQSWLEERRATDKHIVHFSQLPAALEWPPLPEFPAVHTADDYVERRPAQMRQEMVMRGADFLRWQRPGSKELPLPSGRRLLATGEVVEDETAAKHDVEDGGDETGDENILAEAEDE
ncbi:Shaggy-related protein kinase theta [Cytospora mali]|uniref:EKC/KEOPS complex subunit BUD32 n=1 Tax=Cytospora mali TaxID=578113 RepID=A0A194W520_CYTMA|nr:Shaggy-related protein kinase theta [Valsa mali]